MTQNHQFDMEETATDLLLYPSSAAWETPVLAVALIVVIIVGFWVVWKNG